MTDAADDIMGKADAFMKRRRPNSASPANDPGGAAADADDDIPLLTDIVPLQQEANLSVSLAPPPSDQPGQAGPTMEERIAAEVARQLSEQLPEQLARQHVQWQENLNQTLDHWLARELPELVAGELDGLADCLVVRIGQLLRMRLSDLKSQDQDIDQGL